MNKKNIFLLEPGYKNKYPPLGLMKLAQYHRSQNRNHNIVFAKGTDDAKLDQFKWDRIYITTLFLYIIPKVRNIPCFSSHAYIRTRRCQTSWGVIRLVKDQS